MEKYTKGDCLFLQRGDYTRVIEYLNEKIKEQNITFERVIGDYTTRGSYYERRTKRVDKEIEKEIVGKVYYYNIYFLFLGRNAEGERSIYQCGCTAEGYRDIFPYGLFEDVTSSLGRIYDVKIENLLPDTFCLIKDILSEEIRWDEIEIIDQPDSGYEHDFQYIKLKCDKNDYKSRWILVRAEDICEFVEAEGEMLIRPLESDLEDQLEKTSYLLTKVGSHDKNSINRIRELVEEVRKNTHCVFPTYSNYSTIYKDDKILIFNMNGICHLVTDPDVIKAGVTDHIFTYNNYTLSDDIVNVKPYFYKSKVKLGYKNVLIFKGKNICVNVYGDPANQCDGDYFYSGDLRNGKHILLHVGPLITDEETKQVRRLVYTVNKD